MMNLIMTITWFFGVARVGKRIKPIAGTMKAKAVFTCNNIHDDGEDDDDDDDLLDGQTRRSPGGDGPVRDDSSKQRVDCVGEVGRSADVTWSSSSAW